MVEKLDLVKIFNCVSVLNNFGKPKRIIILNLLREHGELNVGQVRDMGKLAQSNTSHHLDALCDSNIINRVKRGKFTFYKLNPNRINEVDEIISKINQLIS